MGPEQFHHYGSVKHEGGQLVVDVVFSQMQQLKRQLPGVPKVRKYFCFSLKNYTINQVYLNVKKQEKIL